MEKKPMTKTQREIALGMGSAKMKKLSDDDLWLIVQLIDRLGRPVATDAPQVKGKVDHDAS